MSIALQGQKGRYHFDPYNESSRIGEGGMGIVYRGEEVLSGKRVAIKVVYNELASNSTLIQRAIKEANTHIDHENLLEMIEFIENDGIYHIISEYLEGESLDRRIERQGPLSANESLNITAHVLNGLQALHQNKPTIIHRDIKPSNIFLCTDGSVKIMDFGVARTLEDKNLKLTQTGTVVGTPHYSAPEQIKGQSELINQTTDIYAVGVTLYEMITGQVPFEGKSEYDTLRMQVEDPIPYKKGIPKQIFRVISKATAKKQSDRFRNTTQFFNSIQKAGKKAGIKLSKEKNEKKQGSNLVNYIIIPAVAFVIMYMIGTCANSNDPYDYPITEVPSASFEENTSSDTYTPESVPNTFFISNAQYRQVSANYTGDWTYDLYSGFYRLDFKVNSEWVSAPPSRFTIYCRLLKNNLVYSENSFTFNITPGNRTNWDLTFRGAEEYYEQGLYKVQFWYDDEMILEQEMYVQ